MIIIMIKRHSLEHRKPYGRLAKDVHSGKIVIKQRRHIKFYIFITIDSCYLG